MESVVSGESVESVESALLPQNTSFHKNPYYIYTFLKLIPLLPLLPQLPQMPEKGETVYRIWMTNKERDRKDLAEFHDQFRKPAPKPAPKPVQKPEPPTPLFPRKK